MIEKEELLCAVWAHVITFLVYPNDEDFRFCQRCGYKPREALGSMLLPQKVPVDIGHIEKRKKDYLAAMRVEQLEARNSSGSYLHLRPGGDSSFHWSTG